MADFDSDDSYVYSLVDVILFFFGLLDFYPAAFTA